MADRFALFGGTPGASSSSSGPPVVGAGQSAGPEASADVPPAPVVRRRGRGKQIDAPHGRVCALVLVAASSGAVGGLSSSLGAAAGQLLAVGIVTLLWRLRSADDEDAARDHDSSSLPPSRRDVKGLLTYIVELFLIK